MSDEQLSFSQVPKKRKNVSGTAIPVSKSMDTLFSSTYSPELKGLSGTDVLENGHSVPPVPGMFRVMKFGGSSQKSPDRILKVLSIIKETHAELASHGKSLVVVVSAQGDTTDWLIDAVDAAADGNTQVAESVLDRVADVAVSNAIACSHAITSSSGDNVSFSSIDAVRFVRELMAPLRQVIVGVSYVREKTPQVLDYVLSFGERLSAAVLSHLLQVNGLQAHFVDARAIVRTDAHFGMANVDWPVTSSLIQGRAAHWSGKITVVPGFIGSTADGRTTTLGRNGSDLTATLLGSALLADMVVINTDVPGVMTADPSVEPTAFPVKALSFEEAVELSVLGVTMFHPRSLQPLMTSKVPMLIRNTMAPSDDGTILDELGVREGASAGPKCVSSIGSLALISVRGSKECCSGHVTQTLVAANIRIYSNNCAVASQTMVFTVSCSQLAATLKVLESLGLTPRKVVEPVAMLSMVFNQTHGSPGLMATFATALNSAGIDILQVTSSDLSYSCIIHEKDRKRGIHHSHAAFNFSEHVINLVILTGAGRANDVSSPFLRLLAESDEALRRRLGVNLRLSGIVTPSGTTFSDKGLKAHDIMPVDCENSAHAASWVSDSTLDQLALLSSPILLDCSGSTAMTSLYSKCLLRGIHVIVSSPRSMLDVPGDVWPGPASLSSLPRQSRQKALMVCDSCVGGRLPILSTIRSVALHDRILRIDCALSGTLNYVSKEVSNGVPLSTAVRTAHELLFTEAKPQDDLSGVNFAEKLLLIAKQLRLPLQMSDIDLVPFVPVDVMRDLSVEDLLRALEGYEPEFNARIVDPMRQQKKHLRYNGSLIFHQDANGVDTVTAKIGPQTVDVDHPSYRLSGTEVFVQIHTAEFSMPLLFQGPGQGGINGAAGVLNDCLKVGQLLRGTTPESDIF